MKKTILLLLALFGSELTAQRIQSIYIQHYDRAYNSFQGGYTIDYSYDANGYLVLEERSSFNGAWKLVERFTFTNLSDGRIDSSMREQLISGFNTLIPTERSKYRYGAFQSLASIDRQGSLNGGPWNWTYQEDFYYKSLGKLDSMRDLNYTGSTWNPYRKFVYSYNSDGSQDIELFSQKLSSPVWIKKFEIQNRYDSLGRLRREVGRSYVSQNSKVPAWTKDYIYDVQGRLSETLYTPFGGFNFLGETVNAFYYYGSFGQLDSINAFQMKAGDTAWVPDYRQIYTYANLSDEELSEVSLITIYPNPAVDRLFIEMEEEEDLELEIWTIEGRLIQSFKFTSGQKYIPITHLDPGYYQLRVKADGGSTFHRFLKL